MLAWPRAEKPRTREERRFTRYRYMASISDQRCGSVGELIVKSAQAPLNAIEKKAKPREEIWGQKKPRCVTSSRKRLRVRARKVGLFIMFRSKLRHFNGWRGFVAIKGGTALGVLALWFGLFGIAQPALAAGPAHAATPPP